jgi:hypothetical protein
VFESTLSHSIGDELYGVRQHLNFCAKYGQQSRCIRTCTSGFRMPPLLANVCLLTRECRGQVYSVIVCPERSYSHVVGDNLSCGNRFQSLVLLHLVPTRRGYQQQSYELQQKIQSHSSRQTEPWCTATTMRISQSRRVQHHVTTSWRRRLLHIVTMVHARREWLRRRCARLRKKLPEGISESFS